MQNQQNQKQVQIKITDEKALGVYANNAIVNHSKEEFIIDFLNIVGASGMVSSRVITSPGHFKRLLMAMNANLKKYEEQFGKIDEGETEIKEIGFQA